MAGYLEQYGVGDERRARVIRWLVLSAIVAVVAALAFYFVFRTYPAKRQVKAFLSALSRRDYAAAYRLWGCAQPCPDYPLAKFLEDWGPRGEYGNAAAAGIKKVRYCNTGVIVTLNLAKGDDVALWYQRSNGSLGFSPWDVCAPRIPSPTGP